MDESLDDDYYQYSFGELSPRAFASRTRRTLTNRRPAARALAAGPPARPLALRRAPRALPDDVAAAA